MHPVVIYFYSDWKFWIGWFGAGTKRKVGWVLWVGWDQRIGKGGTKTTLIPGSLRLKNWDWV